MKLTLPQEDIYFDQLLLPNEPIYNIGAKIRIEGIVAIETLQKAYKLLIDQHDAYRSVFLQDQENVVVQVLAQHDSELGLVDFSGEEEAEEAANSFMRKEFLKPFTISNGSLLHKFILIKVNQKLYYLFSVYHHVITDGWGTSLMFQRLVQNYNELLQCGKIVTDYPFSYKAFVEDDEVYRKSKEYALDKNYWVEKFKSLPENLFDKIKEGDQQNKSSRKVLTIKRSFYDQLQQHAASLKSSTFHLILAALYLYFGRKHQNQDFAIGLPVLNRSKSTFKKTVGLFMGISPLRIQLDFDDSFQELIASIKGHLREDYRHQRFPLGKLVHELQLYNEKEKLFNITLSYEKQNYATHFSDTKTTVIPLTHQSERVALAIYIREFDEQEDVKIDFDYNLNYFDEERISQLANHFENVLQQIIADTGKKLKEFKYLSKEEEDQLLGPFNNTEVQYDRDKTFLDLFNDQVKQTPNHTAVFDKGKKLTYAALGGLSDQVAAFLLKSDHKNGKMPAVGVALNRSVTTVAILLGILKAGKAYIPLDPTFPTERLKYIIQHSGIQTVIIDQEKFTMELPQLNLLTAEALLKISNTTTDYEPQHVKATDTAYVIYTSGSTGNPKGVEIGHRSLNNFLLSMRTELSFKEKDCLLAVTTYSFDISILELFTPLISGASVFMADQATLEDPHLTIKAIENIRPSIIQATPSFYQLLFNAGWKGNTNLKVLCGGDLLSQDLAKKILDSCGQLWNMYGPTETTIWSGKKHIITPSEASNIGTPIANTQFYILDDHMQLLPVGASGVLYIGGDGLAKGYFKAEDLTKEKFVSNPFDSGTLIYNTNDLAKWNSKGEVEFLGRSDNQVKIRGYRIELGEIEEKFNLLPEIKQAVVVAKKQENQESFLIAYVEKEKEMFDEQAIIPYLEQKLPKYMIPTVIIPLKSFPLTPNKKIDRKALNKKAISLSQSRDSFKSPETELQAKLVQFWKEVLHYKEDISIHDNFFALGGHSLNAVKLVNLISRDLVYAIDLKTIFNHPTIELLAIHLSSSSFTQSKKIPKAPEKEYYAITPSQLEIWLASQHKNRSIAYNMVAAFRIEGELQIDRIEAAINKMLLAHEILRTNFVEIKGMVYQKVNHIKASIFHVDVCELEEKELEPALKAYISQEFNLASDLLIKMKVFHADKHLSVLVFCTHHIIMDGGALEHFINGFLSYYNDAPSLLRQTEDSLYNGENLQFKDYAEWLVSSVNASDNLPFWESYLANYQIKESFVPDKFPQTESFKGDQLTFKLAAQDTQALKNLVQSRKVTVHSFLLAALNALIYKMNAYDDICIGTVNAGRNLPEAGNAIGMFVKTLPLRTNIEGEYTFKELLEKVQENVLQINDYQEVPQELITKTLFDILLVFQNPDFTYQDTIHVDGASLELYPMDVSYSRLPLLFNFFELDHELHAVVTYNVEKYESETIQLISQKYLQLIRTVIQNSHCKVEDIDVLLPFEKQKALDITFNF